MRTFYAMAVSPFEDGPHAVTEIGEHRLDQCSPAEAVPSGERCGDPFEGSLARLRGPGQRGERGRDITAPDLLGHHAQNRVLDPDPRWRAMPQNPLVQLGDAPHPHPHRKLNLPAGCHHDVHEPGCCSREDRFVRERGRPCGQHGDPLALPPGQRAGVVETDTRMDTAQFPPPDHAFDIVLLRPQLAKLPQRDHAVLVA
ncbi:hypothetical protein [Pseudactinotalea suaedae]